MRRENSVVPKQDDSPFPNKSTPCSQTKRFLVHEQNEPSCPNKTVPRSQTKRLLVSRRHYSSFPNKTVSCVRIKRFLVPTYDDFSLPNRNIFPTFQTPLLAELSQSSQDSFESDLGFLFQSILGRLAQFVQNWRFPIFTMSSFRISKRSNRTN